jgi:hypothetical protein
MKTFTNVELHDIVYGDRMARLQYEQNPDTPLEYMSGDGWQLSANSRSKTELALRSVYRVTPQPKATYRPFQGDELLGLIGKTVMAYASKKRMGQITAADDAQVMVFGEWYTAQQLFDRFQFVNVRSLQTEYEPCGVEI